jgi:tungstate transport system ATP-binding protein
MRSRKALRRLRLAAMDKARSILPLRVDRLSYRASGLEIISNVSFQLDAGKRTVILGPNGAGKSVLLRLLHGLLPAASGQISWASNAYEASRNQAMVFQRPVMLRRSVRSNIEFALSIADPSQSSATLWAQAATALKRAGIAHLADRSARLCSGGEQQRIAIARAWALTPQLLLLDEPTASLDPAATRAIEDALLSMHAEGATILLSTHDLAQARRIADRVLFLHQGRLLEDVAAAQFFTQPHTPQAMAFIQGDLVC